MTATVKSRRATTLTLSLLAALTLAMAGCSSTNDPTAPGDSNDNGGNGIRASHDAYVSTSTPAGTYGQEGTLQVGNTTTTYLQFDLSGLATDAVVTGTTLHLTQTSSLGATSGTRVTVAWISDDGWSEADIAGDNLPSDSGAESLGTFDVGDLTSGNRDVTFASAGAATKANDDWLRGNRKLTLRLSQSGSGSAVFYSDEAGDVAVRPGLELTTVMGTRIVLDPSDAGWTDAANPSTNTAGTDWLEVAPHYSTSDSKDTFLKFDLSPLPQDAQLQYAVLRATAGNGFAFGGDGNVYARYVSDDAWSGDAITWNNQPSASPSNVGHWWLWYNGTPVDHTGTIQTTELMDLVANQLGSDQVLSLRLDSPGYRTSYYRTASAPSADMRPQLEVLYIR